MSDIKKQVEEAKEALRKQFEEACAKLDAMVVGDAIEYCERLEFGGEYYWVSGNCCVRTTIERMDEIDCSLSFAGNYFIKPSHAEALVKHRKRWGKIERLIIEICDCDVFGGGFCIAFDKEKQAWDVFFCGNDKQGTVFVMSECNAEKVCDYLNKHNIRIEDE